MNVAIVGGGYTGLAASLYLLRKGVKVSIFEKESILGGLASGFKQKNWDWPLEKTYHHFFTNDSDILKLSNQLGVSDKTIVKRPTTASFWNNNIYQFDSPQSLLAFPALNSIDKFRTALLLGILKINPFWTPLENITTEKLAVLLGGSKAWKIIWEPLMTGKFSNFASQIAASWFWARIKKRTPCLGYFKGGFQALTDTIERKVKEKGGDIYTNSYVSEIIKHKNNKFKLILQTNSKFNNPHHFSQCKQNSTFDTVLLTVPSYVAAKIVRFPKAYQENLLSIPHLHAQTLILETKFPIIKNHYWINITDKSFPFLAAVAHTNFIDKKYYGGNHITYFGNYLPDNHPLLKMSKNEILKIFMPFIKKLNPSCQLPALNEIEESLISCHLFTAPHAQPVHQLNYSKHAPKIMTPIRNLYLANLDSIYPWDRGTNYAVKLGKDTITKTVFS